MHPSRPSLDDQQGCPDSNWPCLSDGQGFALGRKSFGILLVSIHVIEYVARQPEGIAISGDVGKGGHGKGPNRAMGSASERWDFFL